MNAVLLLFLPLESVEAALHHSIMTLQAGSTISLREWEQLPALGYETDLKGKAKFYIILP